MIESLIQTDHRTLILDTAIAWFVGVWLVYMLSKKRGVGLPIAYITLYSIIHFGALIYLLPWYDPTKDPYLASQGVNVEAVAIGFLISLVGVAGFLVSIPLADQLFSIRVIPQNVKIEHPEKFGRDLLILGIVFFSLIFPIAKRIPSGAAIGSAGVNLTIVGICLLAFSSLRRGTAAKLKVIAATLSLPGVTVLVLGFVGFGVSAVVEVGSFVLRFIRIRPWSIPVGMIMFWLALSFYVSYMQARSDIRSAVWGGASMAERVRVVGNQNKRAELFDPTNVKHLYLIDERINQNALVGRAALRIHHSNATFADGESLWIAAIAWIPRAIWPSKPIVAGSLDFADRYTGLTFAKSTSVGIGQAMEFYANFGFPGVFFGFMALGVFIRYFDLAAGDHLRVGYYWDYVRYHLIGISALQPGGMFAEVVSSAAAAFVLAYGLKLLLLRKQARVRAATA